MPLVEENPDKEAPAQSLARSAKERLAEFTKTALIVYGNLMNYQHNNAQGVTQDQFLKAMGKDADDFGYVMREMRRLVLKLNPALKLQLNEMVPKKVKKPRK